MKKVLIERTLFIILAIIGIILTVQISSAMAQTNKDYKTELTILTDSQIQCWQSKAILLTSRSSELRKAAQISVTKANFVESNKQAIIQEMLIAKLDPKPHKVQLYLNGWFNKRTSQ